MMENQNKKNAVESEQITIRRVQTKIVKYMA